MTCTQRYGELCLTPRLSCAGLGVLNDWPNYDEHFLQSLKSYEENRLDHMAEVKISATSTEDSIAGSAKKRICLDVSLRDATRMIKVVVGEEKAEWMVHEKVLLANSGFARAAVSHDTEEKGDGTIFLPEADPGVFEIFHKYLYEKRLDVAKLDLDQLFLVYILADYVDCPVFADLVFEVIYSRTSSSSLVYYTHKQMHKVLTSTLPDQPLHKFMLDQFSRQILQKKHNFDYEEAQETLHQVTIEVLVALVQTINNTPLTDLSNLQLPIEKYAKHVSRHHSSEPCPDGAQLVNLFEPLPRFASSESPESRIGRIAVEYVMKQSGQTKERAIKALEDHNYNSKLAISSLKAPVGFGNVFGVSDTTNTTPVAPPASSSFFRTTTAPSTPTQGFGPPNPNTITPASSRGGGGARGRGTGFGRGGSA